jgi:hypothetical protein
MRTIVTDHLATHLHSVAYGDSSRHRHTSRLVLQRGPGLGSGEASHGLRGGLTYPGPFTTGTFQGPVEVALAPRGRATFTWSTADLRVVAADGSAATGFQPDEALSPLGVDAGLQEVAVDDRGAVTVAWSQGEPRQVFSCSRLPGRDYDLLELLSTAGSSDAAEVDVAAGGSTAFVAFAEALADGQEVARAAVRKGRRSLGSARCRRSRSRNRRSTRLAPPWGRAGGLWLPGRSPAPTTSFTSRPR